METQHLWITGRTFTLQILNPCLVLSFKCQWPISVKEDKALLSKVEALRCSKMSYQNTSKQYFFWEVNHILLLQNKKIACFADVCRSFYHWLFFKFTIFFVLFCFQEHVLDYFVCGAERLLYYCVGSEKGIFHKFKCVIYFACMLENSKVWLNRMKLWFLS